MTNDIILRDAASGQWLIFRQPVEVIEANDLSDVLPALRRVETLVHQQDWYAAGFISYEAAPAFDSALQVHPAPDFPLLRFGLYPQPHISAQLPLSDGDKTRLPTSWVPSLDQAGYTHAIARIKEHIARGDTYQVNYTLRLRAPFDGDAWVLFLALAQPEPAPYAAFVNLGRYALCSASPELFFRRKGQELTARPMKGTAPRGRYTAEDRARAEWLYHSEKNRAENLMIVDMIRNDLGKSADFGSVRVQSLFEIERYPTVWQMTSTITATSAAPFSEIMTALFPCASITGAPKARTMQIIADLEPEPRRAYTGCIGYLAPNRQAQFNVAIRTVIVDRVKGEAEYGVGGGIVWDSNAAEEYAECQHKARVLTERQPDFSLLESLLWTPDEGYFLLDYHLRRLSDAADYFNFTLDLQGAKQELDLLTRTLSPSPHKIRLLVARHGAITAQAAPVTLSDQPVRLAIAPTPISSDDKFLFYKTTYRPVYEAMLAAHPGVDDVVLWNERGEVTETCHSNIVVKLGAELVTPPVTCGLLAGTFRASMLDQGRIHERVVTLDTLAQSEAIFRINSVRGWQRAILEDPKKG